MRPAWPSSARHLQPDVEKEAFMWDSLSLDTNHCGNSIETAPTLHDGKSRPKHFGPSNELDLLFPVQPIYLFHVADCIIFRSGQLP